MRHVSIVLLITFIFLPMTTRADRAPTGRAVVAVEVETLANTLDGCVACGCRAKGVLKPVSESDWWFTFGVVQADSQGGWQAVAASNHCANGTFKEISSSFQKTVGVPYVIQDLATTARILPDGNVDLKAMLTRRMLSSFDGDGQPVYSRITQTRQLDFLTEGSVTLPLLLPDPREKSSFGVHEVLLRLRAEVMERDPPVAYGDIAVSADVPGAEILLDGGFVGRVAEGTPTLLENVRSGERVISVRDFSGREVSTKTVVKKDNRAELVLNVLELRSAESGNGLVPITQNPQGYEEYWRVEDSAMMIRIPSGEFLMGSPDGEGETYEHPQHRVYLSSFLIDKTEVTWRQFRRYLNSKDSQIGREPVWGTQDDYPAAFILWQEAKGYCEWTGGRLPTEAEWEKAARGTDGRRYSWGEQWDARRCNSISGGLHRPESVGSFPGCLSPYGALDMSGSMWEWTADWYGKGYYADSAIHDPQGPASGRLRLMRGGAWMSQPLWLRTAYRKKASPTSRNHDHGFRCAQDAPEQ